MERMTLAAEIKAADGDEGIVEGYGSVFNVVDQGGDVVEKGAFAGSLSRTLPKMLWQHDPSQVLGVWDAVDEDDTGLKMRGRINLQKQLGRDVLSDIKMGAINGMSIGYRTRKSGNQGNARVLKEVDLWEVSLVTFPMNEAARIDAVKAADMTEREMERTLRDAGMSRSVARAFMAGGFKAVQAMRDAGEDASDVAALLRARIAAKTIKP